jgi:peptidoglycan/xylan/chitin deacetylase (PgdA/CDA1 family)
VTDLISTTSPPAAIHLDLDGAIDIYKAHGWEYPYPDDPLFESGLSNALTFFERNRIRATLFVIASSLDNPRKRELVLEALRRGHEIASHTLTHPNLLRINGEQKRVEIAESRKKLESLLSVKIKGFRAPGYQIDRECLELLAQSGYDYDSSVFPTQLFAKRLGSSRTTLSAPHRPLKTSALVEISLPDYRPSPFPFSPSYSLLFGLSYFRWGLDRFRKYGTPMVLLFHLTDFADPLPRERLGGWQSRVFTLSNLNRGTKLTRCQQMLDLVVHRYQIVSTEVLLNSEPSYPFQLR